MTRETNMLDVTLGNQRAKDTVKRWKVLEKLNSDHNPTKTELLLTTSP
jgi:hypothetical protein